MGKVRVKVNDQDMPNERVYAIRGVSFVRVKVRVRVAFKVKVRVRVRIGRLEVSA